MARKKGSTKIGKKEDSFSQRTPTATKNGSKKGRNREGGFKLRGEDRGGRVECDTGKEGKKGG